MRSSLRATYRLQIRPGFALEDAAENIPYFDELGISHVYTSPILQATPGSTHGYDVVNYHRVSQEMGGQKGFERLITVLGQRDQMGLVMDIVPNHMAIHPNNAWLWDVLKNGPSSRYTSYFDIDFTPASSYSTNSILIPVLGDQFGRVLESGDIQLVYDEQEFTVRCYDQVYPVDPGSLGGILAQAAERVRSSQNNAGGEDLAFLSEAFDHLPDAQTTSVFDVHVRYRDAEVLSKLLARLVREQPGVRQAIQEVIGATNQHPDALDAFLSRQNYRLALWKISAAELG
jgi:(1->4)-alpha-D-glucan 1-alpha-D-glucosylmutase